MTTEDLTKKDLITELKKGLQPPLPNSDCYGWSGKNYKVTDKDTFYSKEELTDTQLHITEYQLDEPFKVIICNRCVEVYVDLYKPKWEEDHKFNRRILRIFNYKGYWPGYDHSKDHNHSGSILIKVSEKEYIFTGEELFIFHSKEEIDDFASWRGNDGLVYSIGFGKDNIYFFEEKQYIPKNIIDLEFNMENIGKLVDSFYSGKNIVGKIEAKYIDYELIHRR